MTVNLKMLFKEIERIPPPTKDGEILMVDVRDYISHVNMDLRYSNEITFTSIELVSVVYVCEGRSDDFQWELSI